MTSTNRDVRLVISETNTYTNTQNFSQDCNSLYETVETSNEIFGSERPQLQNTECIDMHVQWQCQQAPYGGGYTDLNIVYQNFKKDCFYFNLFGVM